MSEEEKEAIINAKEIIEELNKREDRDFIGRLYYKNVPIENLLNVLINLIDKLEKENEELKDNIETYEETINDYESEAKRDKEKIDKLEKENRQLRRCHLRYEEITGIDLLLGDDDNE